MPKRVNRITLDEAIEACRTGTYDGGKVIAKWVELTYCDIMVEYPNGTHKFFRA